MFDEEVKKYSDGHGCFITAGIKDAKNPQVEMTAGGDNHTSLAAIGGAFLDIAKEEGVQPSELLPFITERLVAEAK